MREKRLEYYLENIDFLRQAKKEKFEENCKKNAEVRYTEEIQEGVVVQKPEQEHLSKRSGCSRSSGAAEGTSRRTEDKNLAVGRQL